jgi:outer membrane protein assembly factor BamD (BamD/ComL family)
MKQSAGSRLPPLLVLVLALLATLAACSSLDSDPTAKWDADRLYAEAKEEMSSAN